MCYASEKAISFISVSTLNILAKEKEFIILRYPILIKYMRYRKNMIGYWFNECMLIKWNNL